MNIRIDITRDTAGPALASLVEKLEKRGPLNAALGKRGEVELRQHFLERNEEPNKKGWPRQQFWNRIRKATALTTVDEEGATIAIADPAFNQKYYGGDIVPRETKYLAIPAIAAAYGKSPLSVPDLVPLIRFINGTRRAIALGTKTREGFVANVETVFYWLVKKVSQEKDPRAFPDPELFEQALLDEAKNYLEDVTG